jgi:hypothetical protein
MMRRLQGRQIGFAPGVPHLANLPLGTSLLGQET